MAAPPARKRLRPSPLEGRQDGQKLIPPNNIPEIVDDPNPVAVSVKSDAQIKVVLKYRLFELSEILLNGRIGVMAGKTAVDRGVQYDLMTRQALDHTAENFSIGAVGWIPRDIQ